MTIDELWQSLQPRGFALRASTPQVAFGCDPTVRSALFNN